ncbi:hypothetical protein MHB65_12630 [Lysinibacillus sp. FSL K6-0075]|uniref:hypothetical protein n=1 Tax=Lysinibacillus sp. FSL K6-0075 TaxID=2921415 RepID=UPI003157FAB3
MKKGGIVFALLLIGVVIFIFSGYRLTPLSPGKANPFVTNDYELVDKYEMDSSSFYLFKSDAKKEYITVDVNQKNFIYRSSASTSIPYSNDLLQTIGGFSIRYEDKGATLFVVLSNDEKVTSIGIQTGNKDEIKNITKGETIHFLLPFSKQIDQLNAIAYDKEGNALYYYGWNEGNIKSDLKWHKLKG